MPDVAAADRLRTPLDEAQRTWQQVLALLREKTSQAHFDTYLRDTRGVAYDSEPASVLRVVAGNPFHIPWLQGRFSTAVHGAVAQVLGEPVRVEFADDTLASEAPSRPSEVTPFDTLLEQEDEEEPAPPVVAAPRPAPPARPAAKRAFDAPAHTSTNRSIGSPLNPRYTFESFIVGPSNQLAYAASQGVAEGEPSQAYNPMFIYGGVGLGKTHLLHAVGNAVLALGKLVVYVSSETFTNELIESIRQHRMDDFRAKYRRANLLLVDDVQFIAGKERTEEEFFHTFNAVHEAGGQIVLSSDRLPRAMTILEDRLRSRFEWGLIADVQLPDYETRVAILRSKLNDLSPNDRPPAEVVEFIAQKVQSNIRELEGSLNRLLAHAKYLGQPATVDLAATVIRDLASSGGVTPGATPDAVLAAVSRYFGVSLDDLRGKARHKEIVVPRQIAMYLLREETRLSTPDIGGLLSRDHTTVLHSLKLIASDISRNGPSRASVRGVREVLAAASH